jgi:hypothetical protein
MQKAGNWRPCRRSGGLAGLLAALAGAAAVCLSGCGKPLLSAEDERSQYDRYDRVRNKFAPQYVMDEFGREQPNLRGRLQPKR